MPTKRKNYHKEYRKNNIEKIRKYNREWMSKLRNGKITKSGRIKGQRKKQCYDCKHIWESNIPCYDCECPKCGSWDIERPR